MKPRLFGYAFLVSLVVLTAIGSVAIGAMTIGGSMLHGECIGGAYGLFLAPLSAVAISLVSLLTVAVPSSAFLRWIFARTGWRNGLRWAVIPLTGPALFCVLAPSFYLLGERDVFLAIIWSFALGTIISTYWLIYLIVEAVAKRRSRACGCPDSCAHSVSPEAPTDTLPQ